MAWYDEAIFYHIYPLGLTGAPKQNPYGQPVNRMKLLYPWIDQILEIGCNALYIGPLFESVGHGYETTDYRKLDSRLGTNEDLKDFVKACHDRGIRVVLDGVFNHTGRDFFAFKDLQRNREASPYREWYCHVDFSGNNEYNDGFSYTNWGGYNLLAKLNQHNPEVREYLLETVRFWIDVFDIDGIRLDAADVLDFSFMQALREHTRCLKEDFWLMGEVIHGDYSRWVNAQTLHSVTDYALHKALYSGHNDHNYFEIAHTVRRTASMGGSLSGRLYNFTDNHDVERIYTKLLDKRAYRPVHILLYTLPGIPSVYYGSEFGIEGKKKRGSDDSLRPALDLEILKQNPEAAGFSKLIGALGKIRQQTAVFTCGDYQELFLTTRQYAFARSLGDIRVIVCVNNDENTIVVELSGEGAYTRALSGGTVCAQNGKLRITLEGMSGEILLPEGKDLKAVPVEFVVKQPEKKTEIRMKKTTKRGKETQLEELSAGELASLPEEFFRSRQMQGKSVEEMSIRELQAGILAKMAGNGPLNEQMRRSVAENEHRGSLLNWIRSFR